MTAAQRGALFAAANRRGMDIAELRALTPAGSISAMTRGQAAALLDSLNRSTEYQRDRRVRPHAPRRPKGVYAIRTAAQGNKIEALRIELNWTRGRLAEFLASRKFADGRTMDHYASTHDARDVILLLDQVRHDVRIGDERRSARLDGDPAGGMATAIERPAVSAGSAG